MVSDEPCFPKICRLPKELTLVQSKRGKECAISTVADTLALRRHFRDIPAAGRLISALYYGTERLCERALATLNTFIGNPDAWRMFERAYRRSFPKALAGLPFTVGHWEFLQEYLPLNWEDAT